MKPQNFPGTGTDVASASMGSVSIGPELHRKLALAAVRKRVSLNRFIAEILKKSA